MNKQDSKLLLHTYLINNNLKGMYTYLGSGSNGYAYKLKNGLVLKITSDSREVKSAEYFYLVDNPNIIKYHQVDTLDNIGYLLMDYIKPLDVINDEKIIINWDNKIPQLGNITINENEIHWGNCGIKDDKLIFFDLKINFN